MRWPIRAFGYELMVRSSGLTLYTNHNTIFVFFLKVKDRMKFGIERNCLRWPKLTALHLGPIGLMRMK